MLKETETETETKKEGTVLMLKETEKERRNSVDDNRKRETCYRCKLEQSLMT